MMRTLIIGLWTCAVALGATYAGAQWKQRSATATAAGETAEKYELKKVKPITAPVIVGGALKGYVSAELSFLGKAAHGAHSDGVEPEAFFMDEAFKLLYSENNIDFQHVDKIDLDAFTKRITERVNERLGAGAIKETFVKNLTFIPEENMPR
jgi:hypothetical protein